MQSLIVKTVQSTADQLESRPGCFELYGFDIILDGEYTPWLLEVNLSPACTERAPWITTLLDNMTDGLFSIVIDHQDSNIPLFDKTMQRQGNVLGDSQEWILLYIGESFVETDLGKNLTGLEVAGKKLNLRKERLHERKYFMEIAAWAIQRAVRKFLVKVRIERGKERLLSELVQRVYLRTIAYENYVLQLKEVACLQIQRVWKSLEALDVVKELKLLRAVIYVQAHIKGTTSRKTYEKLLTNRYCILIQTAVRRKTTLDIVADKKYYRQCVVFIQHFYKSRYMNKSNSVLKIQKCWRSSRARKLFKQERSIQLKQLTVKTVTRTFLAKSIINELRTQKSILTIIQYIKYTNTINCLLFYQKLKAAHLIQTHFRRYKTRKFRKNRQREQERRLKAIKLIQAHIRGRIERDIYTFTIATQAALRIQSHYRNYKARKYNKILAILHSQAIIIQKNYRGFKARRKYQMLIRSRKQTTLRRRRMARMHREKAKKNKEAIKRLFNHRNTQIPPMADSTQQPRIPLSVDSFEHIEKSPLPIDDFLEFGLMGRPKTAIAAKTKPATGNMMYITDSQMTFMNEYNPKKLPKPKRSQKKYSPYIR